MCVCRVDGDQEGGVGGQGHKTGERVLHLLSSSPRVSQLFSFATASSRKEQKEDRRQNVGNLELSINQLVCENNCILMAFQWLGSLLLLVCFLCFLPFLLYLWLQHKQLSGERDRERFVLVLVFSCWFSFLSFYFFSTFIRLWKDIPRTGRRYRRRRRGLMLWRLAAAPPSGARMLRRKRPAALFFFSFFFCWLGLAVAPFSL